MCDKALERPAVWNRSQTIPVELRHLFFFVTPAPDVPDVPVVVVAGYTPGRAWAVIYEGGDEGSLVLWEWYWRPDTPNRGKSESTPYFTTVHHGEMDTLHRAFAPRRRAFRNKRERLRYQRLRREARNSAPIRALRMRAVRDGNIFARGIFA